MARTASTSFKNAKQRSKLKPSKKPYYDTITPGRLLGYLRKGGETVAGSWMVRLEIGRSATGSAIRRQETLGTADDLVVANGTDILSYEDALKEASKWNPDGPDGSGGCTVRDAIEQHKGFGGKRGDKVERNKVAAHACLRHHVLRELPDGTAREGTKGLGDVLVNELTTEMLESFRANIEGAPATKLRVWTTLHSCLEQAYRRESNTITSPKAWQQVAPLSQKGSRREVHFSNDEALAIIDKARAIDAPVADYFEALFRTGARPGGEMFALTVGDFNPVLCQLTIHGRDEETTSKTGERTISLDNEAVALFTRLAARRASSAPLLTQDGENPWNGNGCQRRVKGVLLGSGAHQDAVPYSFRHTFISRRLEAGAPTLGVAKHCGTSVWMIEKNYAKFIRSETLRWLNATGPSACPVVQLVKVEPVTVEPVEVQEAA
jgi:integrase